MNKLKTSILFLILIQLIPGLDFLSSSHAAAFPFRTVSIGDQLPPFTLKSTNGEDFSTTNLKNSPAVLIFWGADLPTKKKRASVALKSLESLKPFLQQKQVKILSINVQGDPETVLQEVRLDSGSTIPFYIDSNKEAYKALGIFVMPSILVIDKDGRIVAGMGYSRNMASMLKGEIMILLGEKTRGQVEKELHPKIIHKTAGEKAARRHLNMGLVMLHRGMREAAMSELKKSLELAPELADAHIELGCLYELAGNTKMAEIELNKGIDLDPTSVRAQICTARLKARKGEIDEAISDLNGLMLRNSRNPELHYLLGILYDKKGACKKAVSELKKAYELYKGLPLR